VLRTFLRVAVRASGGFTVSGDLSGESGSIAHTAVNGPLPTGEQIVTLDFSGIEIRKENVDGPYEFLACVSDTLEYNHSCLEDTTGSFAASEFDVSPLTPTGNHGDQGLDLDQDGTFDVLRASFEVNSEVSGPVTVMGALTEQARKQFGPYCDSQHSVPHWGQTLSLISEASTSGRTALMVPTSWLTWEFSTRTIITWTI
jgi:hypothetical protein